jgi:hypothetical protein
MMNRTKKAKTSLRTEPIPLQPDPISAFRGSGQGRYTSEALLRDRNKERREEMDRDCLVGRVEQRETRRTKS